MMFFFSYLLQAVGALRPLMSNSVIKKTLIPCAHPTAKKIHRSISSSAPPAGLNQQPPANVEFPTAATLLSEEEQMLKDAAAKFAKDKMEPLVKEMDELGEMNMGIIGGLFEQGVGCLPNLKFGI